ncbi:Ribosomal RNA processing protein 1 A [Phlyctochytrium bullatum]|nr:Ribosomal RNA processing protein 1 A [Phlyctochytrium bullatum]
MADSSKLDDPDSIFKHFETPEAANRTLKLKAFSKFENTLDALAAITALTEGELSKGLRRFLKSELSDSDLKDKLLVGDVKLGKFVHGLANLIREAQAVSKKFKIAVSSDAATMEVMRGIRAQIQALIAGISEADMKAVVLGLSHSLSRYKLKFSPDKVDTMIIQAIHLLDDLDKELNTYAMRCKEWYGWHFPEMTKILVDNVAYAKVVKRMGFRTNAATTDLSSILPEELEHEVKEAAEVSMGTEISDEDIENITHLCEQIISISEYRQQLFEYLKQRMNAIAPNLTCLVGELVGARLIAHAGSLVNLSKHPASTVQILGAEKALFRALKSKHDTPKYGLIYHASLVGQAGPKIKGKIARSVATKAALSVRVDALGESDGPTIGIELRAKVESRLKQLEGKAKAGGVAGFVKGKPIPGKKLERTSYIIIVVKLIRFSEKSYNPSSDVVDVSSTAGQEQTEEDQPRMSKKKRKMESEEGAAESGEKSPKKKKKSSSTVEESAKSGGSSEEKSKKKKEKANAGMIGQRE